MSDEKPEGWLDFKETKDALAAAAAEATEALALIAEIETRLMKLTGIIHHADMLKRRKDGRAKKTSV